MILIWFLLRKRYEHRYWQSLPPTVIDRNIVPSFQDLCHKRAIFEDKVSRLERLLKTNPDSTQLQVELQKAIEDLYKNECMISHFTWNARSNMDMEPLLQESVLHSPDMEMLVSSRQSCYGFTNEAGPYGISATFNQYELSNKRSDYSQTSFNSMHGSFDMTLSRKFSSNPLFKASESQKRLMVPEFKTQDNHYYGIPDLENGCSHPDLLGDPYAQQDTDSSLRPDVYLSDDGIELTDMTGKNYSTYGCPSYEIHSVNFDEYGRDMNAYYHNTEFESGRKQQDEEMQIQKSTGEQNSQPSSDDTSIECNKDPSLQLGIYENNIWEETNVINADNRTCDQSLTGLSETKIIDMKGQMASPQTSNMRESDPSAETSKNMEPIQGKTLNGADNFFLNEETNQLSANPPSPAIAELETFSEHEPTHEGFTDTSSSIPTRPILPYGQHPASQSSESFFSQKILSLINSQCERCISEIGELDTVHGMLNISEFKSQSAGSQLPETEPGPSHIPRASQSLRIKDEKSRMWQEGGKNLQTNHHQNVEDFGNKIYATGHENTEDHMSQGNEMSLYTQYQGEICANDGETESQKRSTMDLDAERRRSSGESGLIARKSQVNDRAAGKQSLNWNDSVVSSLSGVSAVGGSVERSDTIGKNSREGVDAPRCSLEENYVLGIRSLHDSSVVKEGSLEVSDAIAEAKEILLETNTRYESTQSAREETTSVVTLEPSVSPSSQSSNQSTPRSLVTSISEQAESLNSKASTVTDFSDTESSDKSDKSDKSDLGNSGSFWQDQMDTSSVLAQQNATTRQADLPDWHVSPPIREVSSRRPFNHPDIVFTCENQENLDSEESSFSTMSSSSQLHEQQQADWFSIPGLSLAELRSIDSRNSESENRGLIHDGSMAANSSPSISFSRDTLSNWVYDDT
ncbi:hypothetical protein KP509_17G007800 [Ceratopteris richardii]|uniref:Uncharacterized protein n=1 Tax=Ceratopteris richardii TaxID=49495 RepID=A0A8T2STG3_CERRI|nr:hypothetical protein KP509_17G007800 [Ceratopteris richardii]